jgi:hypothetical protein
MVQKKIEASSMRHRVVAATHHKVGVDDASKVRINHYDVAFQFPGNGARKCS